MLIESNGGGLRTRSRARNTGCEWADILHIDLGHVRRPPKLSNRHRCAIPREAEK